MTSWLSVLMRPSRHIRLQIFRTGGHTAHALRKQSDRECRSDNAMPWCVRSDGASVGDQTRVRLICSYCVFNSHSCFIIIANKILEMDIFFIFCKSAHELHWFWKEGIVSQNNQSKNNLPSPQNQNCLLIYSIHIISIFNIQDPWSK